uniref:cytochrome P450 n=1 Tax=Streptomyces sp. HSW2009 TaxID=3142890 RepID=UPI0032EF09EF
MSPPTPPNSQATPSPPAPPTTAYSPYLTHHRSDLYPDPDRFVPDRWKNTNTPRTQRSALMPFGAGALKCIGANYAITEATLALATITRWHLTAPPAPGSAPRSASSAPHADCDSPPLCGQVSARWSDRPPHCRPQEPRTTAGGGTTPLVT